MYLETNTLPMGRTSTMPSSTNVVGVAPHRSSAEVLGADGSVERIDNNSNPKKSNLVQSSSAVGTGNAGAGGNGSLTKGYPETITASVTSGRASITGSRSSRRNAEMNAGPLLGPPTVFILRIRGEIHTMYTVTDILSRGPLKNLLDQYMLPQELRFIPSMDDALSGKRASNKGLVSAAHRQVEVRSVAQFVIGEVLKGIISSTFTKDYFKEVFMTEASGLSWPKEGGSLVPLGRPIYPIYFEEVLPTPPLSQLFIIEIKLMGVLDIAEALDGDDGSGDSTRTNSREGTAGSSTGDRVRVIDPQPSTAPYSGIHSHNNIRPDTRHGSVFCNLSLHELDPDLPPSPWTKGYEALLVGAAHFKVYKRDLRRALIAMGISSKGITYNTLDRMYELKIKYSHL